MTHLATAVDRAAVFSFTVAVDSPATSGDTGQGRGSLPGSGLQALGVPGSEQGRRIGRRVALIDVPGCAGSHRRPRRSQHKHTASLLCGGLS